MEKKKKTGGGMGWGLFSLYVSDLVGYIKEEKTQIL